jgi:hypothetical protein
MDARPNDLAAKETYELFDGILKDTHGVHQITVTTDDSFYYVSYVQLDEPKKAKYSRELMEMVIDQIELDPDRYPNYLSIDETLMDAGGEEEGK